MVHVWFLSGEYCGVQAAETLGLTFTSDRNVAQAASHLN